MKRVFSYLSSYKLRLTLSLLIKTIGTLVDLAIPYVLSHIIDNVIPKAELSGKINEVILFGGVMLVFCAIGVSFNIIANRMSSWITRNVTKNIRHDLFEKINSLSSYQIDEVTMPSLVSRMTTDTYNIHQMVGMMQRMGIRAPILLIGGIVITFTMDAVLTLILIAILPFVCFFTFALSKKGLPLFTKVQEAMDNLVRVIRENVTGIRVIKALSKAEYEKGRFRKVNKEVLDYELKSGFTMSKLSPIMNFLLNIGLVFVVVVGAIRIKDGNTEVGKIISFTSYFTIILNAMLSITRIFTIYSRSNASAIRIDYIMSLEEDLVQMDCDDSSEYMIEFRNVYFKYYRSKKHDDLYDLNDINIKLKKGESLGIIGSTGSGKTTIINLLMRFYDTNSGSVFVNGKNVKAYNKNELRKMFGTALQNDIIFSDSILNNIDFYRDIDFKDIEKAVKTAQAYEFISKLENTYNEELSAKGTNISGGQKQRIFISRALAGNPKILILDDASSALDYKTDALLRKEINDNYPDLTSVIITQRISSIINCDYIMMIENGSVLGYGTHEYLLNTLEEYRHIFESQMGDRDINTSSKGGVYNE